MTSSRPPVWPHALENELWAKSAGKGQDDAPESLAQHTWLVLERLADFVRLRPDLPARVGRPSLWNCLYWATFLHDFGKVMPGFQGLLRGDRAAKAAWGGHRHELFSLAFVDWLALGLGNDDLAWVAAAIVSHHRDREEMSRLYPIPDPDELDPLIEDLAALSPAHVRGLYDWLVACGALWAAHLGLDELGVTTIPFPSDMPPFAAASVTRRVRHWLRQYERLVGRPGQKDDNGFAALIALRGHILSADHSGSAHADRIPRVTMTGDLVLCSRGLAEDNLFDHQRAAAATVGSALLVAPTGTGKTEAALLWAARQAADGNAPRLFYTLPYQASMNAMLRRLAETFGSDFVQPQHGRALLATYRWLMEQGEKPENAARVARERGNLARLHYPPVRVFSPYQMLKGMYRLKGYEAQQTDYHDGLFIFDEIHAYEVRRLALILRTIAYLRRHYNARFLIMSATFPTLIRGWLTEALGETPIVTATPELYRAFQRHRIRVVEGHALDETNLARIRADAQAGKSVLVVCNVVARAQKVYEMLGEPLKQAGIEVILLHGRFNMRDRSAKEDLIRRRTGADSLEKGPTVLVATQAVEVSLDIDLDTLYSEAAPLEALVQRFGRVNRRGAKGIANVHIFTTPPDEQKKIYDQRLVERTLALLTRHAGQAVDESAIGDWLDEIYEGEIVDRWREEFATTAAEFDTAVVNTLRPFQSDHTVEAQFDKLFDGMEVLPAGGDDAILREYEALIEAGRTIDAGELLVPLSYGQYAQIDKARRAYPLDEKRRWPMVVEVPYTSEQGLDLSVLAKDRKEQEEPGI
jgi:CRISPR-associated endonuclease/helicase Cas3